MLISDHIRAAIERQVLDILEQSGSPMPSLPPVIIEHPTRLDYGDYSTNIAMLLAKPCRKPPLRIAAELKEKLLKDAQLHGLFYKMEAAPPGFINMYVDWRIWAQTQAQKVALTKSQKANEGSSALQAQTPKPKVIIEHTSINPNKSAHIGHLRNSCIGDTLARMLKRTGFRVEVHNYIDDLGNQLADTLAGLQHVSASDKAYKRFGDFCWEIYAKINQAYKENPSLQSERSRILNELEQGNTSLAWTGLLVAERIVREHLEEMKQFGIDYDVLVWESAIVREGFWSAAFERLIQTPMFRLESEGKLAGCWVLRQPDRNGRETSPGTEEEHQTDKVLVRSNGILTYTAKDIAYHLWKFGLLGKDFTYKRFSEGLWSTHTDGIKKTIGHADMVINVIDHRQEYPQAVVKTAMQALGFEKQAEQLRHVGYGVVSLSPDTASGLGIDTSDGKSSYAMSGRQGIGIKVAEVLDRMEQVIEEKRSRRTGLSSRSIAAAAIRYYLLRFHLQTEIVFDLRQAAEISGNTGVYLLYAYARACSILEKAGEDKEAAVMAVPDFSNRKLTPQEYGLLRQIAYWPETLHAAAAELSPNAICEFSHEMATLFNHFYAVCPILKASGETLRFRLWLTRLFRETLRDALTVLGLPAPSRM